MKKEILLEKINVLETINTTSSQITKRGFLQKYSLDIFLISLILLIIIMIIGFILESLFKIEKTKFKKHYEISLIMILPPVIVMLMLSFANLTSEGFNEMLDADRNNRRTLTYKEKIQLRNEVYNEINKGKKIPIRNTKIMKEYVNKNMK